MIFLAPKTLSKAVYQLLPSGVLLASLLLSHSAQAITYAELVQNVIEKQPEQASLQAYSKVEQLTQDTADQWFSGGSNLIIGHENDALTGSNGQTKWTIGGEVPLWLPGQSESQKKIAQGFSALKTAQISLLKWQASNQLRTLIWQLRSAQVQQEIAQESVKQTKLLQTLINKLVSAGEKPTLDNLLARKALLKERSRLLTANKNLLTAQSEYEFWTQSVALPDELSEKEATPVIMQHPKYLQLQAQLTLLEAETQNQSARQKNNPVLSFGTFQEDSKHVSPNTSLYLGLSYPLGDNPSQQIKISESKLSVAKKKAEIKRFEMNLGNQLFSAKQQILLNQKALALAKQENDLSNDTLKLATQTYQLGASNIQTLITSQQNFLDSKLGYALSRIDLEQAIATYNQIAGDAL